MNFYYEYLQDKDFLADFDTQSYKQVFVKINILSQEEDFVQSIQGVVTRGNININASSPLRRTGSLTVLLDERTNNLQDVQNILSVSRKIALEAGFTNTTNSYTDYEIIWFPLGVYIISNASVTSSSQGINAFLQFKDKMSTLNGSIGGALPAAIELSKVDTIDVNGNIITQENLIYQIIYQLVNHMGLQNRSKIMIDIPRQAKMIYKWSPAEDSQHNLIFIQNPNNVKEYYIQTTDAQADAANNIFAQNECCGYTYTDFVWPNKNPLTSKAGQSITSILDKIKNVMSNYEYFYSLDGTFIWQQIKNYLNTTKVTSMMNEYQKGIKPADYYLNYNFGQPVYSFDKSNLITSYQNALKYQNIKNDFVVWGKRKDSNTAIRYHLAIDSKPTATGAVKVIKYWDDRNQMWRYKKPFFFPTKSDFPVKGAAQVFYYAQDEKLCYCWNKVDQDSQPEYLVVKRKIQTIGRQQEQLISKSGRRVYYQHEGDSTMWQLKSGQGIIKYEDAQGDYIKQRTRKDIDLDTIYYYYEQDLKKCFKYNENEMGFVSVDDQSIDSINDAIDSLHNNPNVVIKIESKGKTTYFTLIDDQIIQRASLDDYSDSDIAAPLMTITPDDWRTILYLQGAVASATGIDSNYYYTELAAEWTNIYDIQKREWLIKKSESYDKLNWFMDFIDSNAQISKYSVESIGRRTKVVQKDDVNCVFQPEIPDFIIIQQGNNQMVQRCKRRGQTYAIAPKEIFAQMVGGKGYNSAFEEVRNLLYENTTLNQQITLQTIPIYHLDVNQVISVYDADSGINGQYLIQSISLPLDISGQMSITATRLLEKI